MKSCFKILFAAACVAAWASCSGKTCKLQGTIEGIEGLENPILLIGETRAESDTVKIENGAFSYACPIDDSKMLNILFLCDNQPRDKRFHANFVPDSKEINIAIGKETSVEGSPLTDTFYDFIKKVNEVEDYDAYLECAKQAYQDNCQNVLGAKFFREFARELSVEEFDEYIAMGTEELKNDEKMAKIREGLVAAESTAVGSKYLDFKGVSPDGKEVSLSDFVGKSKLTLVDFWASWCGPCMRSMPAMAELWKNWHKKGLDMVGVAVWDGDNSASRKRIEEKRMVWPQIFVGDDKTATDIYGISGIPHVIIIDAEGTILYRDVPDEEVIKALVEEKLQ